MLNSSNYVPGVLIWGGVFGFIASIPCLNLCCCIWAVVAGVLGVMAVNNKATAPIGAGEGAVIGLITGGIAGVMSGFIGGIIQAISGPALASMLSSLPPEQLPPGFAEMYAQQVAASSPILQALQWFCMLCIIGPAFGAIGGLIGSAVFKPKVGGVAGGPPPQVF